MPRDIPQTLARPPQGLVLAHEVAQVRRTPGVELRQPGGMGGREVHDSIEQSDVVQAGGAPHVDELVAPGGQGIIHQGPALGGHGRRRRLDGRSGFLLRHGRRWSGRGNIFGLTRRLAGATPAASE